MEDHTYFLAEEEKNEHIRRKETKIDIGVSFPKWKSLMRDKCLQTDAEVASFLLFSYETSLTTKNGKPLQVSVPAESTIGASDRTDRDEYLNVTAEPTDTQGLNQSSQDISSVEEDMEENVFNEPSNSLIKWADEASHYFRQKDDGEDDDEERLPPVCIRTGGALKKAPSIDGLPVIGMDETVHDHPADEEPPEEPSSCDRAPGFPGPQQLLCEDDIISARASIVYEVCLRQLAAFLILPVEKCSGLLENGVVCNCVAPFDINITSKGTAMSVEWICPNGHSLWRWNSQPVMSFGMQAGDFLLSTNILLSGNNYSKVALLFRFMNMGMVKKKSFLSIQDTYCVDTVKDFWEERRIEALSRLQGKDVVVLVDGTNVSSGHCAQYCTLATMETDTKEIIHVSSRDKQQMSSDCVDMEKEGFMETVDKLTSEIKLVEICTAAHAQIEALMNPEKGRYKALGIHHSVDVWHGAKKLAKKIAAAAKTEGQSILLKWLKDVVNHFWWCCKTADTTEQFLALWVGILHHVCDIHTWTLGSCQHGHLEEPRGKEWIQRDSKCHKALVDIVLSECWHKDVQKYLRFRSTADLETFQNHILMYASEGYAFSPRVYEARVLLAALDYNFHRSRPTVKTAEGKKIFRRLYKKHSRGFSVYALRSEKTYGYISELQSRIVKRRIRSEVGMCRRRSPRPDDPRGLRLLAPIPAPAESELMPPHVRKGRGFPADVQQLLRKEEVKPEWSPGLDQEDPEPLIMKEEQEEMWTNQEGGQVVGLDEVHISRFPFAAVTVKSEDEENPESSDLYQSQTEDIREPEPSVSSSAMQIKTETDEEDCAGLEPTRNLDPDGHSEPNTDEKDSNSSKTEANNDDEWQEPLSDCKSETEDNGSGLQRPMLGNLEKGSSSQVHTGEKPFACDVCGKAFNSNTYLKKHMRVHTGEKRFCCDVCGKAFNSNTYLKTHMRVHTGEKPFGCDVCGKRFNQRTHLNRHMRVHTGEKPFGCDLCGRRFTWKDHFKEHMRVHTGEIPFRCDVCGKRFHRQASVKTHMSVHTGEKPFGCEICEKRFALKKCLKMHMQVHTGEKPFSCDVCGKSFTRKAHFKIHMRLHTEDKQFGCGFCGKAFNTNSYLKTHMKVHTEKLLACEICEKRFAWKKDLKKHMSVHAGVKPFSCDVCGKGFTWKKHLKEHSRVHTGEKPFGCDICSKRYKRQRSLKTHMALHTE